MNVDTSRTFHLDCINLLATDVPRSQQGVVRSHSDVGTLGQVKIIKAGYDLNSVIGKSPQPTEWATSSRPFGPVTDAPRPA